MSQPVLDHHASSFPSAGYEEAILILCIVEEVVAINFGGRVLFVTLDWACSSHPTWIKHDP